MASCAPAPARAAPRRRGRRSTSPLSPAPAASAALPWSTGRSCATCGPSSCASWSGSTRPSRRRCGARYMFATSHRASRDSVRRAIPSHWTTQTWPHALTSRLGSNAGRDTRYVSRRMYLSYDCSLQAPAPAAKPLPQSTRWRASASAPRRVPGKAHGSGPRCASTSTRCVCARERVRGVRGVKVHSLAGVGSRLAAVPQCPVRGAQMWTRLTFHRPKSRVVRGAERAETCPPTLRSTDGPRTRCSPT